MSDISRQIAMIEAASRGEDVRDAIISALNAVNGGSIWNADDAPRQGGTNPITSGGVYTALQGKEDRLQFDSAPAEGSANPVTSGGIYEALRHAQGSLDFDDAPTQGSSNPVTSDGIYQAIRGAGASMELDEAPTRGSTRAVRSDGIYTALSGKQDTLSYDQTPTAGSSNIVNSGDMYTALMGIQSKVAITSVTLGTSWTGNMPYRQAVEVEGATAYSKIDIQPGAAVIKALLDSGVKALWIENDGGTFTACAIGGTPSSELTVQCMIQETGYDGEMDAVPTEGSTNAVMSWGVYDALAGKEDSANKTAGISASSTNDQYPSAKAAWDLVKPVSDAVASKENLSNKVAQVTASSTDTQYPSAKAVWSLVKPVSDSASSKENSSNKTTQLSEYSTDTQFPSAKAVWDLVQANAGGVEFDSAPTQGSTKAVTSGGIYNALLTKETASNKSTSLSASSTDAQYPSAKAVWALFNSITDGNSVSY